MRLFEALTIAFAGQVALAVAVMGASRPRWMNLLPLAPFAFFAAHLLLEGPRWQMVPVYLVVFAATALGVLRWRRFSDKASAEEPRQLRSRLAAMAGILLLAGSIAMIIMAPGR